MTTVFRVDDNLYLGSYPVTLQEGFTEHHFDIIINCAKEIKYDKEGFDVYNYSIIDGDSISFLENIDDIHDLISVSIENNKKIYVHCAKGLSRSPAVIVYYLMMNKGYNYCDAINFMEELNPQICIDDEFQNILSIIDS